MHTRRQFLLQAPTGLLGVAAACQGEQSDASPVFATPPSAPGAPPTLGTKSGGVAQTVTPTLNVPGPVVVPTDGQWGPVGTADDSATFQRALSAVDTNGSAFYIPRGTWRVANLAPPAGVSLSVTGASKGATLLRPPVAAGAATIWNLSNRSGPAITFEKFSCTGRQLGKFDTTGMLFYRTNGVRVYDVWFNGLLIGTDWSDLNTDNSLVNCNFDMCGTGIRLLNVPTPTCVVIDTPVYTQCQQDLQISNADCSTFVHTNGVSLQAFLISILATNCTNLVLDGHQMDSAVVGIELTNTQEAELRNIRHTRCKTDYSNRGTFRVFTEGCNGNLAPFIGAQLFTGSRVGNKKTMVSTAVPTTLAWQRGDRVLNAAPAVGQPKGWICTVAGTPGTWVSEGNL